MEKAVSASRRIWASMVSKWYCAGPSPICARRAASPADEFLPRKAQSVVRLTRVSQRSTRAREEEEKKESTLSRTGVRPRRRRPRAPSARRSRPAQIESAAHSNVSSFTRIFHIFPGDDLGHDLERIPQRRIKRRSSRFQNPNETLLQQALVELCAG